MRVVVTGGAGFVGSNLVHALVADGDVDDVVVIDDLSTGRRANLDDADGVQLVEGSVLDTDRVRRVCEGADAVVHLAARPSVPRSLEDPVASHTTNASGTVSVLEAARAAGNPHVIVASSSSVYGADPVLPTHEDMTVAPRSPYAASKLATEAYAQAYGHAFGADMLVLRFFNVFGPRQPAGHAYAAAIPAFVEAALEGRSLTVHGDGRQTRDFTYVGDVCEVLGEALRHRVTHHRPVNLAFGRHCSLLEVVDRLEAQLGTSLDVVHTAPRAGDVRCSRADQSRLRSLFPDVRPVAFEQGLSETIAWFRASEQA